LDNAKLVFDDTMRLSDRMRTISSRSFSCRRVIIARRHEFHALATVLFKIVPMVFLMNRSSLASFFA
jgi:hypothetical protein